MAKTPSTVNGSGGSTSNRSAFTKALQHVRRKLGINLAQNTTINASSPRSSGVSNKARKSRKGTVYTRSSAGMTSDIFSSIEDETRLQLIKDMGFQGFKYLNIHKSNKDFAAWLLSKFDPVRCTLLSGTRSEIKLTESDVNLILGIPCEGKPIVPATHQEVVIMKKYICNVFGKESFEQITLPFLTGILYKKPESPMSVGEAIKFKTALIMVLVTIFLGPVSLNNHISTRYMTALVDIDNVQNYNWSKFVIDELKVAADSLHNKLKNGKSAGYINGCIILLQIFYLDNLENGNSTPEHSCFPRIRSYDDKIMDEFIKKDMILQNRFPFPSFGKLKLRDRRQVCYSNNTFASQVEIEEVVHHGATRKPTSTFGGIDPPSFDLGLSQLDNDNTMGLSLYRFESIQKDVHHGLTPKPTFSIGGIDPPSFDLGLSQLDNNNTLGELTPANLVQGNLEAQFDTVADQAVVPETPPDQQGVANTETMMNSASFSSPHSILKHVTEARITLRNEQLVTKYLPKSKKTIIGEPADLLVNLPARIVKPSTMVKSPFLCKPQSYTRNESKALDDLFQHTTSIQDKNALKKLWVHISNPVPMKLHLSHLQHTLKTNDPMDEDTFNLAVQALYEDELHTFGSTNFVGWRHFLNQDFAMYAIAADGHWNPTYHIHLFTDPSIIPYNVSSCRLIFVPIYEVAHYALYAFDMEKKWSTSSTLSGIPLKIYFYNTLSKTTYNKNLGCGAFGQRML
ncbi:uncharacterized protein LOC8057879 isoform X4 [Sorghum bicolor]|uniref:uncharacterized protein LOC8057879 isoform X4 n=1 Tax=Sorghum bicolor TaxID=4558 RepID=UPI000B4259A3|nr:uncharacterized protein LOC8057879 isoform X4 [Sorghum bicolor]|eukprot:XP_021319882.1 uncharacterized protein LOC8057879 isoform X4 [Sorghum bicolor]